MAEIRFDGFEGELLDLNGPYMRASAINHGKPTFKKIDAGNNSVRHDVMIYYWDERDGAQLRGWWVAPEVGGSNVWAMSTATSNMPPHSGWRVPWHGDVNKKCTLSKVQGSAPQTAEKRPNPAGGADWANPASKYPKIGDQYAKQPTMGTTPGLSGGQNPNANAYGTAANNVPLGAGSQYGQYGAKPYGAYSGAGPTAAEIEEQRRINEEKRKEQDEKRRQVIEQTRQERKLSESVNGCVLATSNAERSFLRVKDSQASASLFAMETIKPPDLARFSAEVEKGLKAAMCSLQSAGALQQRKLEDLENAITQNPSLNSGSKTLDSLRTQLQEAKNKIETCQEDARSFAQRVSDRQKSLWMGLVGNLGEQSAADFQSAETAVENLKDQSALLSSEIAEHLSPQEAIQASDSSADAAQKAEVILTEGREALHKRRTEIMTAINFFRQSNNVMAGILKDETGEDGQQNGNKSDPLNLVEKKKIIEEHLSKYPVLMSEVTKIKNLATHIGNRARQAETIRKKQEAKEAQKRRNERRARWNKLLIQDLGSEVTLCVDSLSKAEEMKLKGGSKENIQDEFKKLKSHLERAKKTYEDFRSKQDTLQQTTQEIERWGSRIEELEAKLKEELSGKDAEVSVAKQTAEIPGNLVVAGLLIEYLIGEGKTEQDLFEEIDSIKGGEKKQDGVTLYKLNEWVKRNPNYFGAAALHQRMKVDMPPADPKTPNTPVDLLKAHLKEAFDEVDLPTGSGGVRTGVLNPAMFSTLYRKFFVYESPAFTSPTMINGTKCMYNNFGRNNVEGVLEDLSVTSSITDSDDSAAFPALEHRTVVEMCGPLHYPNENDKSRVRFKIKVTDKNSESQVGFCTYYCNGKCQLHELTTMKVYQETVLTQNAEFKQIKMVKRVKKDEYFRILDMSPCHLKQMVRIYGICLADEKCGYITISSSQVNAQSGSYNFTHYLKSEELPKPKDEKPVEKAIPVLGSTRVSIGEAVAVKLPGETEFKHGFLQEKRGTDAVMIAWAEDEVLEEVKLAHVRSAFDQKKTIELSEVTKEDLHKITKAHMESILSNIRQPECPPQAADNQAPDCSGRVNTTDGLNISLEEQISLAVQGLKDGEDCQRDLTIFRQYINKREIRFLVLGDPAVFEGQLNRYNAEVSTCNKLRLKIRSIKQDAEQKLANLENERQKKESEMRLKKQQEEERQIVQEMEVLVEQAKTFTIKLQDELKKADKSYAEMSKKQAERRAKDIELGITGSDDEDEKKAPIGEDGIPISALQEHDTDDTLPDWDTIVGDIQHALKECKGKVQVVKDFVNLKSASFPNLAGRLNSVLVKLENMQRIPVNPANAAGTPSSKAGTSGKAPSIKTADTPGTTISADEKLERIKKQATEHVCKKYTRMINASIKEAGMTAPQYFSKLLDDWEEKTRKKCETIEDIIGGANDIVNGEPNLIESKNRLFADQFKDLRLMTPEILREKFPTSFDFKTNTFGAPALTQENFVMLLGNFYYLTKEAGLTSCPQITKGKLIRKLPAWTVVQMSGKDVIDPDTENTRRKCKVLLMAGEEQYNMARVKDATLENGRDFEVTTYTAAEFEANPSIADRPDPLAPITGWLSNFDPSVGEQSVKPYDNDNLKIAVSTVMTTRGDVGPQGSVIGKTFKPLRRIKEGELLEPLSLPLACCAGSANIRIKAKAVSDGTLGWYTVYNHTKRESLTE